jgi:hypothetical protein
LDMICYMIRIKKKWHRIDPYILNEAILIQLTKHA